MLTFTFWQDGRYWLGYLNDYPDYQTQAKTLEELQENLKDIYTELNSGVLKHVRKVQTLTL